MSTKKPNSVPAPFSHEESQRALMVFTTARLEPEEHERLRAHLLECDDCRDDYRRAVRSLARMSRTVRERKFEPPRRGARTQRARAAIARAAGAQRRGRFGLRLFVMTAGLIFLFTAVIPRPEAPLTAEWSTGEVNAADVALGPALKEQEVHTGDWCYTQESGRAVLAGAGLRASLATETVVLVEDSEAPRLRLQRGTLELEGEGTVMTPSAAVSVDGRGQIEIVRGALFAECLEGELIVFDAAGERELAAGESLTADPRTGLYAQN